METMCERCERLDVQVLKERSNRLILIVDKIARIEGIKEPNWEKRVKAVNDWADKEIARLLMSKRKQQTKEGA